MWEEARIVLFVIVLVAGLSLPWLLMALAFQKKKLSIYKNQLKKTGKISKPNTLKTAYDLFIAAYLLEPIPEKNKFPTLYKNKKTRSLIKNIKTLSKITKPLALVFFLMVFTLIILLNIFEG